MKRFGEFIRQQRETRNLDQADIKGFNGPYISEIERGIKYPARKTTVEKLAKALSLDNSEYFINWLWIYSLLDEDPRTYFAPSKYTQPTEQPTINKTPSPYNNEIHIHLQSTEDDVIRYMGPPDKKIRVPSRCKWIYEKEGLHIVFTDGRVTDIAFK